MQIPNCLYVVLLPSRYRVDLSSELVAIHIKEALILSVAFDQDAVEAAKREAAVMAVMDRTMLA